MYQRLDALPLEVFLQFVSAFAEYGELVIYIVLVWYALGQGYKRIIDMVVIVCSKLLTLSVVFVQVFQFHIQHSGIDL